MADVRTILMLGWEFPPFNSGGLGVACEGLIRGLNSEGKKVLFVLPKKLDVKSPFCRILFASGIEAAAINSLLAPYLDSSDYQSVLSRLKGKQFYGQDLFSEVRRYALEVRRLVLRESFDLIHAHDWLCFPAGLAAKQVSGKPLVVQVHATEFDRTGGQSINEQVYQLEKAGMEAADAVIAVSNFTKGKIIRHYGISPEKIRVVYNAIDAENYLKREEHLLKNKAKIVLFLGRLTLQKGPDYFLRAAKRVLEKKKDVIFVLAGSGDMENQLINLALDLGIADKVIFTGFLRGEELRRIYQMADLYVLSSVSEPFGITVLESLKEGTPVLISRQSGAAEVISHCLKVDFWDIEEMAGKILAFLSYRELQNELCSNGLEEVRKFSWQTAAQECLAIYDKVLSQVV